MSQDKDPTLKGLGRRMGTMEDTVDVMQANLSKLVTFTQRIQWTFTGLAIYYIIDNGQVLKLLMKVLI